MADGFLILRFECEGEQQCVEQLVGYQGLAAIREKLNAQILSQLKFVLLLNALLSCARTHHRSARHATEDHDAENKTQNVY
jgi:hypothetical protein